jgi:hypothetical protein
MRRSWRLPVVPVVMLAASGCGGSAMSGKSGAALGVMFLVYALIRGSSDG